MDTGGEGEINFKGGLQGLGNFECFEKTVGFQSLDNN